MNTIEGVKRVLRDTLQLGPRADSFDASTGLLGSLPEFDSMAVVNVITAIEESFGVTIDDDEISAANFQTIGSLSEFVQRKLGS